MMKHGKYALLFVLGMAASSMPAMAQTNGELVLQIQQLQNEARNLRGMIEEQQIKLNKLEKQQIDFYEDLDSRIGNKEGVETNGNGVSNANPVQAPTGAPTVPVTPKTASQRLDLNLPTPKTEPTESVKPRKDKPIKPGSSLRELPVESIEN